MTWGTFGCIMPVQVGMVLLAAIDTSFFPADRTDDELIGWMRRGREWLTLSTSVDLGYDLVAWHDHILTNPELAEEYAWHDDEHNCFADHIRAEFDNPRRLRLAERLTNEER